MHRFVARKVFGEIISQKIFSRQGKNPLLVSHLRRYFVEPCTLDNSRLFIVLFQIIFPLLLIFLPSMSWITCNISLAPFPSPRGWHAATPFVEDEDDLSSSAPPLHSSPELSDVRKKNQQENGGKLFVFGGLAKESYVDNRRRSVSSQIVEDIFPEKENTSSNPTPSTQLSWKNDAWIFDNCTLHFSSFFCLPLTFYFLSFLPLDGGCSKRKCSLQKRPAHTHSTTGYC